MNVLANCRLCCSLLLMINLSVADAREIIVAKTGNDDNPGTAARPYLTINRAAQVAQPGDIVTVKAGDYREWVNPARGGTSDADRIVYRAAPGERVRLLGSEQLSDWQPDGQLWRAVVPAAFFGDFNPFNTLSRHPETIEEDHTDGAKGWGWMTYGKWTHRGDVYIDGEGLTEKASRAELTAPYTWYAEIRSGVTYIWANFAEQDPRQAQVEINVREQAFYPETTGLSYITVRGFTVLNVATHWAPPTAFQPGAIASNGGHHWIIEDNIVQYSKAVCISIGNPSAEADHVASGYHIIRNNIIRRCGQAGIAGEHWNKYSTIQGNVLEDINYRQEFGGWETAAIKFHHGSYILIDNNFIRGVYGPKEKAAAHGIWIDYSNKHFRITRNVISKTDRASLLFEANWGGPFLIDNNIFIGGEIASLSSQGETWVHNMFIDVEMRWENQTYGDRPPVKDASWFNNVFIGTGLQDAPADAGFRMNHNLFLKGARKSAQDQDSLVSSFDPQFAVKDSNNKMQLILTWKREFNQREMPQITADYLQLPVLDQQGKAVSVEHDFFIKSSADKARVSHYGPFSNMKGRLQKYTVYKLPRAYKKRISMN